MFLTGWPFLFIVGFGKILDIWNTFRGGNIYSSSGCQDDTLAVRCPPEGRIIAGGGVDKKDLQMEYLNGRLRLQSMDGFLSWINKTFKISP